MVMILTPGEPTPEHKRNAELVAKQKAIKQKRLDAENKRLKKVKSCPFKNGNPFGSDCLKGGCALYQADDDKCYLAMIASTGTIDTTGKSCPLSSFTGTCREQCALYVGGGCLLTALYSRKETE